ncbi:monooxygenase [Streptosporangium carneum]|uniref:Monooxygenase n=1 Tax=Streptosporangium carneum TaxID=47481 RepID=A0A9W6I7Q3_9ACTN|nr:monooxygenase [Streptosporangium carneum]
MAIIGAGIGGLCLAQGLRGAGVDVAVYERDRTPSERLQGYRIHIDPGGARALHECLPRPLWEAFLAAATRSGQDFGFLTEKMDRLLLLETPHPPDPLDDHHSVSRIALRRTLLSGLSDVVRFGRTYERYTREPDGTVSLHFADGTTETADVVVGADGGNSRVRRQYLPHARRIDTGIVTLAGKFPLTDATRALVAPRLWRGPNMVIPPRGCGMFTAPQRFGDLDGPGDAGDPGPSPEKGGTPSGDTGGYVMWVFGAASGRFPDDLPGMTGERLRETVARMIEGWHPDLRRLVTASAPETVSLLPIRTSVPVDPWPATNITLLGDAVHSMTPMRGTGANIALRDAQLLTRALSGGQDPVTAIADYEARMREYGFAAVRRSLMAARQFVDESRLARAGFRTALRVAQRFPALRRRALSR